jgi:hypothetical protein
MQDIRTEVISSVSSFILDTKVMLSLCLQLEYLVATVHGKLRSGRAGPFVKVEGCCD